jgi:apolipoprotein D and lipocalin family protein
MRLLFIVLLGLNLSGCLGKPEGVEPIDKLEVDRYLGQWYEIARLDHSFERGLDNVSATYSLREDGGIRVINAGRSEETGEISSAEGRAYFVESETYGHLKVSFFGPFFGSYVIFDLDKTDYQYAFVAGNNHSYLWLLARTPQVSDAVMESFINQSALLGFDTDALIFVPQDEAKAAE